MEKFINNINWKKSELWKGCIFASIAHAIMVAHYPELAHEHSWDGINYNIQNSSGARGTVTFHLNYCVAAFRDSKSTRLKLEYSHLNTVEYFKGAPQEINDLAEVETLQYLLDKVNGKTMPVITTAFWGINENLFSRDTFDEMVENGGFLLERQVLDLYIAAEAWKEYYDMSEQQCFLLKSIFERKIDKPAENLILTIDEVFMIGTEDQEGLNESKLSFNEIGITW